MKPLDPKLLHPALLGKHALFPFEQTYLDTLIALRDSLRSEAEMAEAASVLNPLLEARVGGRDPETIDAISLKILKLACAVRDARSGMACDFSLDLLQLSFDEARELIASFGPSGTAPDSV
jgi:hypothetical protein